MKQPLMLTQSGLPPAQAEALYETVSELASLSRLAAGDAAAWPGEDWEDEAGEAGSSRALQSSAPALSPFSPLRSSARH